jgi:hypothetical protein
MVLRIDEHLPTKLQVPLFLERGDVRHEWIGRQPCLLVLPPSPPNLLNLPRVLTHHGLSSRQLHAKLRLEALSHHLQLKSYHRSTLLRVGKKERRLLVQFQCLLPFPLLLPHLLRLWITTNDK